MLEFDLYTINNNLVITHDDDTKLDKLKFFIERKSIGHCVLRKNRDEKYTFKWYIFIVSGSLADKLNMIAEITKQSKHKYKFNVVRG